MKSRLIEFARAPQTDQNGYFFKGNILLGSDGFPYIDVFNGDETSYDFSLPGPGTYYVHVGTEDTKNRVCPGREFSHTFQFTVEGGAVTQDVDSGGGSPTCPVPGTGGGSGGGGGGGGQKKVGAFSQLLVAPRVQRLSKLYLLLQISKPGRLIVRGTVNVPGGAARVYRFRTQRRSVAAKTWVRVRLRLAKKGRRAVTAALRGGKRLRARVKVIASDRDGHRQVKRTSIRLRA